MMHLKEMENLLNARKSITLGDNSTETCKQSAVKGKFDVLERSSNPCCHVTVLVHEFAWWVHVGMVARDKLNVIAKSSAMT